MSATPLVDAHVINTPNPWLHAEAARGIEIQLREEIGRLKEAEVEAQHRIRTLIEERDSARIKADLKWRLREEFESLLGTSDVKLGMFKIKQLKHALSMADPKCDHLHHPKKHQHKITEPCPVEELIRKAQKI